MFYHGPQRKFVRPVTHSYDYQVTRCSTCLCVSRFSPDVLKTSTIPPVPHAPSRASLSSSSAAAFHSSPNVKGGPSPEAHIFMSFRIQSTSETKEVRAHADILLSAQLFAACVLLFNMYHQGTVHRKENCPLRNCKARKDYSF